MVVFRRPETTRRVFDAVRHARPSRLYISADGPRRDRPDDPDLCAQVRQVVERVDWPCHVVRTYHEVNVGLRRNMTTAVSAFLAEEGEGVILEDDTVPSQTFFEYCDALLERHRHNERVGVVSGYNPAILRPFHAERYYFSDTPMIWGWATWERAWSNHETTFANWDGSSKLFPDSVVRARGASERWIENLSDIASGRLSTVWSYPFIYHCWANQLLSTIPGRTLVVNVGFGKDATHTNGSRAPLHVRKLALANIEPPLKGPTSLQSSRVLDAQILADYWKMGGVSMIQQRIASLGRQLGDKRSG